MNDNKKTTTNGRYGASVEVEQQVPQGAFPEANAQDEVATAEQKPEKKKKPKQEKEPEQKPAKPKKKHPLNNPHKHAHSRRRARRP